VERCWSKQTQNDPLARLARFGCNSSRCDYMHARTSLSCLSSFVTIQTSDPLCAQDISSRQIWRSDAPRASFSENKQNGRPSSSDECCQRDYKMQHVPHPPLTARDEKAWCISEKVVLLAYSIRDLPVRAYHVHETKKGLKDGDRLA
jgi:hypothetical protein